MNTQVVMEKSSFKLSRPVHCPLSNIWLVLKTNHIHDILLLLFSPFLDFFLFICLLLSLCNVMHNEIELQTSGTHTQIKKSMWQCSFYAG